MPERASTLVTVLFTDLAGSTELLSRAGDEDAQRIFRAHHTLLAETGAAHGGAEVKWLGDGLMAAFVSAADALRCAIAMQQATRRPVCGERLAIRVGLNAGEAFRDEADYFGTPVVVARRLCDRAQPGQIVCSELVAGLLAGRAGFAFAPLGPLELKGVPQPVAALEVRYEAEAAPGLVARLPFVGRQAELSRLIARLGQTAVGHGGLVFVVGEPGIGKTRLTEELGDAAVADGFSVLWGHCLEGDWAPPYAPFAEVIESLADGVQADELRADLRPGGAVLAQLVPRLRQAVPDLPDVVPVQPDEERFRLLEAMAQVLAARARRAPVLLCLDDLHWADSSTVAMLRHVARTAPRQRLLILGTYRDPEVGGGHPLHEALGAVRREVEFERLKLGGLEAKAVAELLEALADLDVLVAAAIAEETDGNPFFIKEVLRHLLDEGRFRRAPDGRWTLDRPVAELGIPEGVREVIDRRLARLSTNANKLLSAASVFDGDIHLDVAATVGDLDEDAVLDALDEALHAQLLQPAGGIDVYRFTHALIRHTLANDLSPSRRARLRLRAAKALAAAAGANLTPAMAGEIAAQFHRSRGLPGAEDGVAVALIAAGHSENTGGQAEAARFLRMALDLMREDDPRRAPVLGRLGMALIWGLALEHGLQTASEAARLIGAAESPSAAAQFLADAAWAMAAFSPYAWELARQGLQYTGATRDATWARLIVLDLQRRDCEDAAHPGLPVDTPERWEAARILRASDPDPAGWGGLEVPARSRAELAASRNFTVLACWVGNFAGALPLAQEEAERALARGQTLRAARCFQAMAFCQLNLGRLAEGQSSLEQAEELAAPTGTPVFGILHARENLTAFVDDDRALADLERTFTGLIPTLIPKLAWALGPAYAIVARTAARVGRGDEALDFFGRLVPWLERAPAWTVHLACIAGYAAETLWLLERLDEIDVVENALRTKVLAPDFRDIGTDARLSLARVCAIQGRHDEAIAWFADARRVLTEQGARPLLAIADYDEALMYVRRGNPGDSGRAKPLLDAAHLEFETIGMIGWVRRTEELRLSLT